jgi:hypothetical protein
MTAWSDYVKAYASEHGLTFSVAMKMPEVKLAYKETKKQQIDIEILEEEIEPVLETIVEPVLMQIVEPIVEPVVEIIVEHVAPAPPAIFIAKKKRVLKPKA